MIFIRDKGNLVTQQRGFADFLHALIRAMIERVQ